MLAKRLRPKSWSFRGRAALEVAVGFFYSIEAKVTAWCCYLEFQDGADGVLFRLGQICMLECG
ncbi:hypothetical protein ACE6H2_016307 [Prunus campanulata]